MKPKHLFLLAASFLFASISCKKDKGPGSQPSEPETVFLLDSMFVYESVGGAIDSATHVFSYDSEGRLTEVKKNNLREYSITYSGGEISGITLFNATGNPYMTATVPSNLIVNDDSISYHYTIQGQFGVQDTVRESFMFKDSILLQQSFHLTSPDPNRNYSSSFEYVYDNDGNLEECLAKYNNNQFPMWRVRSVDDKKNLWHFMPLAYVFGRYFDVSATGINNVTSVDWGNNNIESWEWTYNDEGYPLTVKSSNQSHIRLRFVYRQQ